VARVDAGTTIKASDLIPHTERSRIVCTRLVGGGDHHQGDKTWSRIQRGLKSSALGWLEAGTTIKVIRLGPHTERSQILCTWLVGGGDHHQGDKTWSRIQRGLKSSALGWLEAGTAIKVIGLGGDLVLHRERSQICRGTMTA
jgi:hypothetical protein